MPLCAVVVDNLRGDLSPEQIASTLKRMSPRLEPVSISHNAIYQALYPMPRGELRTEVLALLRPGHLSRNCQVPSMRLTGSESRIFTYLGFNSGNGQKLYRIIYTAALQYSLNLHICQHIRSSWQLTHSVDLLSGIYYHSKS
jgi:hypothetical protein